MAEGAAVPSPPPLTGRRLQLRPVMPYDVEFLYELATGEDVGYRWRFLGHVPNFEVFSQQLWHDVLVQFVIVSRKTQDRIGLVVCYTADLRNGYAHMAIAMKGKQVGTGIAIEAASLFVNYLFATFNLRKIYAEATDFNFQSVASGKDTLFREEGRLVDHYYYQGRFWDQRIVALHRADWERLVGDFLPRFLSKLASEGNPPEEES